MSSISSDLYEEILTEEKIRVITEEKISGETFNDHHTNIVEQF